MRKRAESRVALIICTLSLSVLASLQTSWAQGTNEMIVETSGYIIDYGNGNGSDIGYGYGLSGVCVSNAGGDWGASFDEGQIDLIRDAGASIVKISTNWWSWLNSETRTQNSYDLPYNDYIKQLCDWCEEKGLISCIGVHSAKGWSIPWEEKVAIIEDTKPFFLTAYGEERDDPRQDYIDWAVDMLTYCDPDWIDVMSENTRPASFTDYRNFCMEIISAYRSAKPSIHVIVEGHRDLDRDGRTSWSSRLIDFMANPLPFQNITYDLHRYWRSDSMPDVPGAQDFVDGNFVQGRASFYDYFDYLLKIGDYYDPNTLYPKVIIGEWGAYEYEGSSNPDQYPPNWDKAMQAFYDWCKYRDIPFLQWDWSSQSWPLMTSDKQNLNLAGQLWADNI